MNKRNGRVSFTLQRELGVLIDKSISDPRLAPMTSVTRVECTADFSIAHVYISSLGDTDVRQGSLEALESASGFLRREVDKRIQIRHVPRLVFHLDDTLLDGANMLERMDDIAKQDSKLPTNRFVDEEPELESGEEEE
jgi:ribosome-binding factor A